MFHRVKSEVQDTDDQNTQAKSQPVQGAGYGRNDEPRGETSAKVEKTTRGYGAQLKSNQQEETKVMKNKEETAVQGKYSRPQDDAETSGYQPSIARSTPAYGSSYASSYTPPQAPEAAAYSGADRVLTIGRGINMSGEIDACDHLLVEGTVEAALKGAKLLDIAESGTFYGTVEIEEATIAGRFEGDITVNGRLTLKSTGVITGSIAYRELEIESGAVLDGRVTPLKGAVDPKSIDRYRAGSEASAMAKPKDADNREPANAENGLFSKTQTR